MWSCEQVIQRLTEWFLRDGSLSAYEQWVLMVYRFLLGCVG